MIIMIFPNILLAVFPVIFIIIFLRFLSKTSFLHIILRCFRSFEDLFHVYQFYKVPQFNENFQPNHLFRKVSTYLSSLPAMEDSDFTNLFSGPKSNDIILRLDENQVVQDSIFGATVWWSNQKSETDDGNSNLVLKLRKKDKKRILRPYLQHILAAADEIEQRNKEIKFYMNLQTEKGRRWRGIPFTHPATIDTVVMDGELKNKIKADLESFLKSKQYYHRLGRVWKRSYLLYGGSGTGKSSFVAGMARFLNYDVYEIDMSKVSDDSDLKMLLLQTTSRSIIVIEDLDQFLGEKPRLISKTGIMNFMDGIISSCGEERVMVFTMNKKIDEETVMRPGRIDVHIEFKHCNFTGFKSLANSYLGVKEHKLFSQVEEMFESSSLSPAEIGEIMISNRNSPSRALKSVISAMQMKISSQRSSVSESSSAVENDGGAGVFCRESVHTVREFRKLYGLLKMGSRRKEESPLIDYSSGLDKEKEASRHAA
ncbi:AAA-ATPase At2g46620-like [Euphorbia lathyris]|uniref:AAA-ATPase At2g46620-like n=1 Tax=Euphorbia lathyris TaxID=212925 RepID=UPI00331391B2